MDYIASYVFKPNRVLNYLSVIRDSLKDTEVSVVMEVSPPRLWWERNTPCVRACVRAVHACAYVKANSALHSLVALPCLMLYFSIALRCRSFLPCLVARPVYNSISSSSKAFLMLGVEKRGGGGADCWPVRCALQPGEADTLPPGASGSTGTRSQHLLHLDQSGKRLMPFLLFKKTTSSLLSSLFLRSVLVCFVPHFSETTAVLDRRVGAEASRVEFKEGPWGTGP